MLTNQEFLNVMKDIPELPLERKNSDFVKDIEECFKSYLNTLEFYYRNTIPKEVLCCIEQTTTDIKEVIKKYHMGLQSDAYYQMKKCLTENCINNKPLIDQPVNLFYKDPQNNLSIDLYRIRENTKELTKRSEMFHVPAELRGIISTSRYSIDGFPSLYLATSIQLARIENNIENAYASLFKFARKKQEHEQTQIKIIDLGLRPIDFTDNPKKIDKERIEDPELRVKYLAWYPIIAACSFIRSKEFSKSFASEYIIPQLLMQVLRKNTENKKEVVGIRYFSCKSKRAANIGYNYVFPVSDFEFIVDNNSYCENLEKSFNLTEPIDITALSDIEAENALKRIKPEFLLPFARLY